MVLYGITVMYGITVLYGIMVYRSIGISANTGILVFNDIPKKPSALPIGGAKFSNRAGVSKNLIFMVDRCTSGVSRNCNLGGGKKELNTFMIELLNVVKGGFGSLNSPKCIKVRLKLE